MPRKNSDMFGDMYSLGNHEHDILLSDSEDFDRSAVSDQLIPADSNQINVADGFESDTTSNTTENNQSGSSEDESTRMLPEPDDKEVKHTSNGRTMKASLARKLMEFGVDTKAGGDFLDGYQLCKSNNRDSSGMRKGDGSDCNYGVSPTTAPLKWLSKRDHDPDYELIRNMVLRTEKTAQNIRALKNQQHCVEDCYRTIGDLDRCVSVATSEYWAARTATNKLSSDMEETMIQVAGRVGETWDYFRDLTGKWIKCLSGSSSCITEFDESQDSRTIENEEQYCENQRPMIFANAAPAAKRKVARVKTFRVHPRFNIISENIRKSRKTKPRNSMRLPKLTEEETHQIDELLKVCKNEDRTIKSTKYVDHTNNYYLLEDNERKRLDELNASLGFKTHKENVSSSNSGNNNLKTEIEHLKRPKTEQPLVDSNLTASLVESVQNEDDYNRFRASRVVHFALGFDKK